jgi:hypothetical protein
LPTNSRSIEPSFIADLYRETENLTGQEIARRRVKVALVGQVMVLEKVSGIVAGHIRDSSLQPGTLALAMRITTKTEGYSNIIEYPSLVGSTLYVEGYLARPLIQVSATSPTLILLCTKVLVKSLL